MISNDEWRHIFIRVQVILNFLYLTQLQKKQEVIP